MYAGIPRLCTLSVITLLLANALTGCGSKSQSAKDSVYGKVTLNGQPVAGQVVFVGQDKKEVTALITPEGEYRIVDPPKGEVQVFVRGSQAAPSPKGGAKGAPAPEMPGMKGAGGVAPPPKYATAAGGLKFTVTGGEQKYDIELMP